MIDIYLCEDETMQLNYFKRVIDRYLQENHIKAKIFSARKNPEHTLADSIKQSDNTAVFFIDIELKGYPMNGFELARKLKKQQPEAYIVFLTSREELAYRVFEYKLDVLDYIIKRPEYFLSKKMSKVIEERIRIIFEKMMRPIEKKEKDVLTVECGSRIIELEKDEIIFVQAVKGSHQIELYLPYKKIIIRKSLRSLWEQLDNHFIYINKSCFVQISKIQEIDKKNRLLIVEGDYELDVSYRELKNVCDSFQAKGMSNDMIGQGVS